MVNKKFCPGILVMILVFGMAVVGCDNGDSNSETDHALIGTWIADDDSKYEVTWKNNGSYEEYYNGIADAKGIYSISDNNLTAQRTHVYGSGRWAAEHSLSSEWYTKDQLNNKGVAALDSLFLQGTGTFTVTGNSYTITWYGTTTYTYTKKK